MKKLFGLIVIGIISSSFIYAQSVYVNNALKFSTNDYGGTARFVGMGGAFGALGGDFSSIAVNPAGLGVYRSSELVFSPGLTYNSNSSTYIGNSVDANGYSFNLNNMGFVASYSLENSDTRWIDFNFGVGFNRTADFNDDIQFQGVNNSSLLETYVIEANDYGRVNGQVDAYALDGMYEFLFWSSDIMPIDSAANEFYTDVTDEVMNDPDNFEIFQRKIIRREGGVNEFNFSFGGNYAHKLYIGASIGITRLRYEEYASHYEYETDNLPIYFTDGFDFRQHSSIKGTGFTLKLGAIYKPIEFLRIGAAVHLPTFYSLEDEFYNDVTGYFETYSRKSRSVTGNYEYQLSTPLRAIGSLGFQIGKVGLIDVDYEYVNYSKMELDDDFNDADGVIQDNADIENIFQATHNIRLGGEFRYGPLYFRAGGKYSTSPYENISDYDKMTIAGGLGYREKNFFVDFAFSQTSSSYKMIAYDLNAYYPNYVNAEAKIDNKLNNFILTFGLKF